MFQPISTFNLSQFNKIPIHPRIFVPFAPQTHSNMSGRTQLTKSDMHSQTFEKFSLAFEESGNAPIQPNSIWQRKGKLQFVYAWNSQCLDVAHLLKSTRYRFLLTSSGPVLAEIKRRLLVVINHTHVYIHDLIRQNSRLICSPISRDSLSPRWLLSLSQHEHYIYTILPLSNRAYPTAELQLYGISMAQNFNLELKYKKRLVLCQEQCQITEIILRERDNQVGVCAIASDESGIRIFIGKLRRRQSSKHESQFDSRLELQFVIWQADSFLVNQSRAFEQDRYSRIRSSWFREGEEKEKKEGKTRMEANMTGFEYEWTENYSLVYRKDNPNIVVIQNCAQPCTKIISHDSNILHIVAYAHELIYLADESGQVWEYDLQEYEEDVLKYNCRLVLNIKQAPELPSFQSSSTNQNPTQIDLFCSRCGRLGLILDGSFGYVTYPRFLTQPQPDTSYLESLKYSTQIFLSIQPEQFRDLSLLGLQKDKYFLMPSLHPFLSYSTRLSVNLLRKITLEILPIITAHMLNDCLILLDLELTSILEYIFHNLERLKADTLGTIYDCQDNQFYWILTDLWIQTNSQNSNDVKSVLSMLVGERKNGPKVLEILLNQHKFRAWLVDKCQQSKYALACITNYMKCQLIYGCPCIFKRLLKQFICRSSYCRKVTPYIKFDLQKDYLAKDLIIQALRNNEIDKLELLVEDQQSKIDKTQEQNQRLKQVDTKWDNQFQSRSQEILPNFSFSFPVSSSLGSFSQTPKLPHIILDQSQKYQNQLFQNCDSSFRQKILYLSSNLTKRAQKSSRDIEYLNSEEMLKEIYNLCTGYGLIFRVEGIPKHKLPISQVITMGTITIGCIYRVLLLKTKSELEQESKLNSKTRIDSRNFSQPSLVIKQGLRGYWTLIIRIVCQCLAIKYSSHQQLLKTLELLVESIGDSKLLPPLADQFSLLKQSGILTSEEYLVTIRSWYETEKLRFEKQIKSTQLQDLKFRYNQYIWENGVQKLGKIYDEIVSLETRP